MMGANDPKIAEKPLPREPALGMSVLSPPQSDLITRCRLLLTRRTRFKGTGTEQGQSSLTRNIYTDRVVENKPRHGDQSGSSHLGRDAALGAGAVGTSAHRHEEPQRDNYATESDRSFPLRGNSASNNYGSNTASSHVVNKVDPRVDGDGSHTAGNTGYESTSAGYGSNTGIDSALETQGSLGRDTLGAGVGVGVIGSSSTRGVDLGSESSQHGHQHHGHQYEGDPYETEVFGGQGGPHFVSGPHTTDTANRLDPRVGSGFGGTSDTGISNDSRHHGHHVHRGEEATLVGSAGAAGLGGFETENRKQGTTENNSLSESDPSNINRHVLNITEGMDCSRPDSP